MSEVTSTFILRLHKKETRNLRFSKPKMKDIIMLVFFAKLANANEWTEIEVFGKEHEEFLRRYLELPYGIPSHDTIQRVFAIVSPEFLQNFRAELNKMLNSNEGEKIKKILALDEKTQCGNDTEEQKQIT